MSQVEIDEVLRFVRHVRPKVSSNDAVPRRVVFFVEFLLDVGCYVLLDVELLHRLRGTVHSLLLHIFRHVGILNNRFALRHLAPQSTQNKILVDFALLLS